MVKRYDFYDRNYDAARAHANDEGDYVTHADYAGLQARADALEAALQDIVNECHKMTRHDMGELIGLSKVFDFSRLALAQHGKVK